MHRDTYDLKPGPEETATKISVRALNLNSVVRNILNGIPESRVADILVACYLCEPVSPTRPADRMKDDILTLEGDLAVLELRGWGGDTEDLARPLFEQLARASTEFYQSAEGQQRLNRILSHALRSLGWHPPH
ncbi:MAG: hypothetical protein KDK25_07150 [Leptospiraceae bacterium]|nr:hypothetical protein [Leptospiraceae bacterium]